MQKIKTLGDKISVLLVDDNKITNFYNKWLLSNHGMFGKIQSVNSGLAAIEYIKSIGLNGLIKPDLIFLDINMPAMNGWEFLEEFDKLEALNLKDIVIVILSTSSYEDDLHRAEQNPLVNGFVSKPLREKSLDFVLKSNFPKKNRIDIKNS